MDSRRFLFLVVLDILDGLRRSYALRRFVLGTVLGIVLPYVVQRWDKGRLPEARRARAWNGATWGAALYAVGPLSLIPWCVVTRFEARRWWRESPPLCVAKIAGVLALGLGATLFVVVLIGVVDVTHAWLSGMPLDD
jgi:hypothetical protein